MWKWLKRILSGKADVRNVSARAGSPGRTGHAPQRNHSSALPDKSGEAGTGNCGQYYKALTRQHRILEKRLIRMGKDISVAREAPSMLASSQEEGMQAVADFGRAVTEAVERHLTAATGAIETRIARLEQIITESIIDNINGLKQQLDSHAHMSEESSSAALEQANSQREIVENLNRTWESMREQQSLILDRLARIEEKSSVNAAIEQTWRQIKDFDEFISTLRGFASNCPSDCFANKFAAETISRLEGMRTEAVKFLAMHDAFLIDSMERFDPARHRPLGTCPRPDNATGDGIVQRVGLTKRNGDKERVCHPALVTLFHDVEV